ncbi:hypothetical protein CCAX7_62280 [Capsulimonas corticalis]|uniref:DUF6531 domain-containing protein n=2 Tax=Capsulimonas corticalis TaxID=2219043 RepID=A0A402CWL3_9BACT|nr:hypothetical protein CCAX7_62280 [Capsulimonas corticalis]
MDPGLYIAVTKPGSTSDKIVAHACENTKPTEGVQISSIGSLASLHLKKQLLAHVSVLPALRHVARYTGTATLGCASASYSLHCPPNVTCPMADGAGGNGGCSGPSSGDPVNLATGEEEYSPAADITVYNLHGPAVVWNRIYNSLRPWNMAIAGGGVAQFSYEADDFGAGWSHPYNILVQDSTATAPFTPVPQGGSGVPIGNGTDHCASGVLWDIVYAGSTVASSSSLNGWTFDRQNGTVTASSSAAVGQGYEVRWDAGYGVFYSAFFEVVPNASVPQGMSVIIPPTGANAAASGLQWDIVQGSTTIATSNSHSGWSVGLYTYGFQISAPMVSTGNYEVRFAQGPSATFSVIDSHFSVGLGDKYILLANGARIRFTAASAPTAGNTVVRCSVLPTYHTLVDWHYDSSNPSGYYTITLGNRTVMRTTPPVAAYALGDNAFMVSSLVSQISNATGSPLNLVYGAQRSVNGFPLLSSINDASNGSALLTIARDSDGSGHIHSVSDPQGRSVYYSSQVYVVPPFNHANAAFPEVTQVSQIVPSGTSNPPMRYAYDYQRVYAGSGPMLHTITVPSPTGVGVSTSTINYNDQPATVSSTVDGNGNMTAYTPDNLNHTRVTTYNPLGQAIYSYVYGFDNNMSLTTKTDGAGTVVYAAAYSDPNNPTKASSVTDGNGYGTIAPGGTQALDAGGTDGATGGIPWEIVGPTGAFVASSGSPFGWTVSFTGGSLTVSAPSNAVAGSRYEVRATYSLHSYSAYFNIGGARGTSYYRWDQYGNLTSATSPRGVVTSFTWDYSAFPFGELVAAQEGGKTPITYTYCEPSGLLQTSTGPSPAGGLSMVSYTYDSLGNPLTIVSPGNNTGATITSTFNYTLDPGDSAHGVAPYSQPAALGQALTITNALGQVIHIRYNALGQAATTIDPLGHALNIAYNISGQKWKVISPLAGPASPGSLYEEFEYLYPGSQPSKVKKYDEDGHLMRQVNSSYGLEGETVGTSGDTHPINYEYDALYRLKKLTDSNGHSTKYYYNPAGYLSSVIYPGGDTTQMTSYDLNGNPLTRIDGRGVETDYVYNDVESLLTDVLYPLHTDNNVHVTFDGYGRRGSATDNTGTRTYNYNDNDLTTSATTAYVGAPSKTFAYAYYPNGSRKTMSTPAGDFNYSYDAAGRLKQVGNPFSETDTMSYMDNGWLQSHQLGNGAVTSYSYNAVGQLFGQLNQAADGTVLSQFSNITYDGAGNRLSITSTMPGMTSYSGVTDYTYDSLDQLLGEQSSRNGGYTHGFAYDAVGNTTTFRGQGNSFNSNNQNGAFTFDANGNPIQYHGVPLSFDEENRLVTNGH